ncbi:MAG: hypothetical protein RL258_285 [Pseudomonadota bacterium]
MENSTTLGQQEIDSLGWQFEHSYARLPEVFFARVRPEPVSSPALVICNSRLASELGLDLGRASEASLSGLFAGAQLPSAAEPIAQAYAGHQFGHFTMLGDGRAVLLGEQMTPTGVRYDLQFKGSGRTPFSRRGDGRAALGPMLREYLISEAMHGLGIPTTRSLAVVGTGDWVYRDGPEPGAVLTRVAASHLRVGSFQYAAGISRQNTQGQGEPPVRQLLNYAIGRHYPELIDAERPALAFLQTVITRQVSLLVHWMRVGFIHGVMNTDNMAISGETIDYGPCAFIDSYHPDTVFSSIDHAGRYAFGNQPAIAQWNLARLAEALLSEIDPDSERSMQLAVESIESFSERYEGAWLMMMARKIGLVVTPPIADEDKALILDLLRWMQENQADYTYTFWRLGQSDFLGVRDVEEARDGQPRPEFLRGHLSPDHELKFDQQDFRAWKRRWTARIGPDRGFWQMARGLMARENPVTVPRNALVEAALQAAVADCNLGPLESLLAQSRDPYRLTDKPTTAVVPGPSSPGYRTFCGT